MKYKLKSSENSLAKYNKTKADSPMKCIRNK